MLHEISHRCPSCGASVRDFGERAMFCPECGKTLTETRAEKPPQENSEVATESAANNDVDEAVVLPLGVTAENDTAQSESEPVVIQPEEVATAKAGVTEKDPANEPVIEDRHTARERTRETLHRASTRARDAIEDNVKRVEKIHHVSTVMWEEATYDPSLRFVLVALGLFVVFVILLVLSKVMG
jgi:predicted  nucleic acid-binding Zn-ribbon protein